MYLIVGLGNVGEKYEKNRHNVGFLVLDSFVTGGEWQKKDQFNAMIAFDTIKGEDIIYLKPTTMMNRSGQAVRAVCQHYDIEPENVIVIYDDLDLPIGDIRVSFDRGNGGHNGIKSIEQDLGTRKFHRIRVGISPVWFGKMRRPKGARTAKFVLKDFGKRQEKKVEDVFSDIEDSVRKIIVRQ